MTRGYWVNKRFGRESQDSYIFKCHRVTIYVQDMFIPMPVKRFSTPAHNCLYIFIFHVSQLALIVVIIESYSICYGKLNIDGLFDISC